MALSIGLVRLVETGFLFSFFWCVAGAIYLLMRQDVDDKELDDIYVPAETPAPKAPQAVAATPSPEPSPAPVPIPCVAARVTRPAEPFPGRENTSTSLPRGEFVMVKSLPWRRPPPSSLS